MVQNNKKKNKEKLDIENRKLFYDKYTINFDDINNIVNNLNNNINGNNKSILLPYWDMIQDYLYI